MVHMVLKRASVDLQKTPKNESNSNVRTMDTRMDPRHPSRLEKKKNIRHLSFLFSF